MITFIIIVVAVIGIIGYACVWLSGTISQEEEKREREGEKDKKK